MKREWYCLFLMLAVLMLVPAMVSAEVKGDWGNIDWKQFEGTELNVLSLSMPVADVYAKLIPQFEELTGIKVHLDLMTTPDRRKKMLID